MEGRLPPHDRSLRPANRRSRPHPRSGLGLGAGLAGAVRPLPDGLRQRRGARPGREHRARVLPRRPARARRPLPLRRDAVMGGPPTREAPAAAGMTFRPILLRFTLAGALAGALAGLWSLLVTERAIDPA